MNTLTTSDFTEFFSAVWTPPGASAQIDPFAWQQELLEEVAETGRWPDLVDIPTGLGKTATIDIALFALAMESANEPERSSWRLPHRIVMVVDRRVVVDQAFERATELRERIEAPDAPEILTRVRDALRHRSAPDPTELRTPTPALLSSVLRGGIVRDETWARRPDVPAVLASTVDQVGSRLLFRGYGLTTGARPIHAGLLGNDTLFLLDEVHLAQPFAETLDVVARHADHGALRVPRRFGVVQLTATPAVEVERRFPPTPLARPDVVPTTVASMRGADAVVARRTGNAKPADLEPVKAPADPAKANEAFAKVVEVEVKKRLVDVSRIAVMVNRVDTARRAAIRLRALADEDGSFDVSLLTGRMRPVDRDDAVDAIAARLEPGLRLPGERPLVVVATQSLEAGADFDFDLLVTECASLDALRQRFGRVDRDGQRWAAGRVHRSVVLCRAADIDGKEPDAVYGTALTNTWHWLDSQDEVDFGHRAMPTPEGEELLALTSPRDHAPLLAASHLDRWVQTSEREVSAEPEVAQWLHGVSSTDQIADVQVIWRDLPDRSLFGWTDTSRVPEDLAALLTEALAVVPPLAREALPVPIGEVRRWLRGEGGDPTLADAPMAVDDENARGGDAVRPRLVARWVDGAAELVPPQQVRPGDTIVVPASAGGIALGNWAPGSTEPVEDVSLGLTRSVRSSVVVPLTSDRCEEAGLPWPDPTELELLGSAERRALLVETVDEHRTAWGIDGIDTRPWRSFQMPTGIDDDGQVIRTYVLMAAPLDPVPNADDLATDGEGDELSLIGRPMRLANHLRGVGFHAESFATALGWPPDVVAALRLAGEVHDAGKVDSRFQAILAGGTETGGVPLAKSGATSGSPQDRRAARRATGYPRVARHELLSLAMIDRLDTSAIDVDADLVAHLVATHHGWGRYRFRPVVDDRPEHVDLEVDTASLGRLRLDAETDHGLHEVQSGHGERFWRLVRRYGWWELAQTEAVLRLADHHRSHLEQRNEVEAEAAFDLEVTAS